jgi:hypothetical protein
LSAYRGIVVEKRLNLRERDHFEDIGVNASTILE